MKKKLGLIGKNISYSFSENYFNEKFKILQLENYEYVNFDIATIEEFPKLLIQNRNLIGLSVTIPYKQSIIPFLASLSNKAFKIGAVNTIKFNKKGNLKGYNTDCYGFKKAIKPLLKHHKNALILGTGGASKAVAFALNELNIKVTFVSRTSFDNCFTYEELTSKIIKNHQIIVNCTPIGTFPNCELFPPIPYNYLTKNHLVFDLIYNPEETAFLKKAKLQGAEIKNGLEMLLYQAEKAWQIWNK